MFPVLGRLPLQLPMPVMGVSIVRQSDACTLVVVSGIQEEPDHLD